MKKLLALCFLLFLPLSISAKVTIPLWHAFSSHLAETLKKLCTDFNQSQEKYVVKPIYKGSYQELLSSYVAAFKAHKQPPIVQIYEVGSALMIHPKGVIKPVGSLFAQNEAYLRQQISPAIFDYYSDKHNQLLALPFNSSAPILYYNKTLLDKAHIKAPKTWEEVYQAAVELKRLKLTDCALTTTYPAWVHVESFLTRHNLNLLNQNKQGELILSYQHPALIKHLRFLKSMQDVNLFEYGGREGDALSHFTSGHCAMMTESSGAYKSLSKLVPFTIGITELPYWASVTKKPGNTVIGGAALWVSQGFDKEVSRGIKAFFTYLLEDKTQAYWAFETGYMPLGDQALQYLKTHYHDADYSASQIALAQTQRGAKKHYKDNQIGYYALIRLFNDQQIEAILSQQQSVASALKTAETYANILQKRFKETVRQPR